MVPATAAPAVRAPLFRNLRRETGLLCFFIENLLLDASSRVEKPLLDGLVYHG
jgi:hypothetical protein